MKKAACIILSGVLLLYAFSMGVAVKLSMDYKNEEFHNTEYFMPEETEKEIAEWVEEGSMTFEDAVNAMTDYDTRGLDMRMPNTCYTMFFDSGGNFLSEAKCVLKLKITTDEPFSVKRVCIDLDKYMSDELKAEYVTKEYEVDTVELCRENDTFIPVALNVIWYDKGSDMQSERIVLSDYEPNVTYDRSVTTYGNECITFEVREHHLYNEENGIYDYLKSEAEGYRLTASTLDGQVHAGGCGFIEDMVFTEYSYSLTPVHFGNYTYFLYSAVGINYLEAVLKDSDFIKLFILMTAVFTVFGAGTCAATVYVINEEE